MYSAITSQRILVGREVSRATRKEEEGVDVHSTENLSRWSAWILERGAGTHVDKDGLDCFLAQKELKRLLDRFRRSSTSHIQEVGRAPSREVEHVHRGHGQSSAVDETSDRAVELDEI